MSEKFQNQDKYRHYRLTTQPIQSTSSFADKGEVVDCPKGSSVFTHGKFGCADCDNRITEAPYEEHIIHCRKAGDQSSVDAAKSAHQIAQETLGKLKTPEPKE